MAKLDINLFIREEFTPVMAGIQHPVPQGFERTGRAKTEFINLTPHTINVIDAQGAEHVFTPMGLARLDMTQEDGGYIDDFKVTKQVTGEITGLPEKTVGKIFIVSLPVAQAAKRHDVVAPDTGSSAVRENGQIKAVRGFVTF